MKSIFDILLAIITITMLSPVLVIVTLLIIILERDTPFFTQERIGKDKSPFTIFKYRTMKQGEITQLGKILRRTGIDELPQLFNILLLDMSFVGPRPLTVEDIVRLGWDDEYYEKRWNVRPGIVGLAQLSPVCHKKMSWFYDKVYILKMSPMLDLKILCSAIAIPFVGKDKVKHWIHAKS